MTVAADHNVRSPGGTSTSAPGAANASGPVNRIDPSLPQVFGRYLLVQRLSRGGMGEIFLAKHGLSGFEKLCVIKKVLPSLAEDESFISRFVDEAQVAIKLQHVNIAQVFEVGRVGDEYFLALEYVEGRDLRRTLQVLTRQKRRFPPELALFVGREVANGLAYAHRRTGVDGASLNLVHCDISPPNVLVSFEGETKIIDFGIAKSRLRATATDPKMGFGKFGYMAPEQLIRGGVVDLRTDIYAAGVVLHELLTGERLYELGADGTPDYRALARAVSRGEHDLPSDIDPALAPYDGLVARALRPKLEDRYQTAAEFRDAIQTALVQVSPTISSDQLGAYLREVFTDEMNAHAELVERISHMHLDDFKEQLTTQTVETVSFALANMPLVAPPDGVVRVPTPTPVRAQNLRPQQQSTAIAGVMYPSESGPTRAPASGTGTVQLAESDVLYADLPPRRRNRLIVAGAAVAALAAVVIVVVAASGSSSGDDAKPPVAAATVPTTTPPPRPAPAAATEKKKEPAPVVVPLPAETTGEAAEPELELPAEPAEPKKKRVAEKKVEKRAQPDKKVEKKADPATKAEPTVDAGAVMAKFKAVSREYKAFKQAYGSRLEGEWGELLTLAQYAKESPEKLAKLDRKIDRFRSQMEKQK